MVRLISLDKIVSNAIETEKHGLIAARRNKNTGTEQKAQQQTHIHMAVTYMPQS